MNTKRVVTPHCLTAHLVHGTCDYTETGPHPRPPPARWWRKLLEIAGSIPRRKPGNGNTHMLTEKLMSLLFACFPILSKRISEPTTTTWIPRCMCTICGLYIDSGLFLFEHHANQVRDSSEDSKIGQSLWRHQIRYTMWRRQSKHRAQFGLFSISNNSALSTPFIAHHNRILITPTCLLYLCPWSTRCAFEQWHGMPVGLVYGPAGQKPSNSDCRSFLRETL